MKFKSGIIILIFLLLLTGCASEDTYINDAADLFKAGNYKDAETAFLKAIRN